MVSYKDNRLIDGKPKWIITDEEGNIINRNPSKEELKGLKNVYYKAKQRRTYTNEELLNYLKQFYHENDRAPKKSDFGNNPEYPGKTIYYTRFGNWKNALEKAELLDKRKHVCVYTREEISDSLIRFYEEYIRVPTASDFRDNPLYINYNTIRKKFGSWNNALKTVGLDPDTLIKKGIRIQNSYHKGRRFELYVGESFGKAYEDLSGKNHKSSFDGICPNGMPYEVKSSSFNGSAWNYNFYNSEKEKIRWYYLGAFDQYYEKLLHTCRVPAEIIIGERLYIGLNSHSTFNIENMKQYEITNIFLETFDKKNITW